MLTTYYGGNRCRGLQRSHADYPRWATTNRSRDRHVMPDEASKFKGSTAIAPRAGGAPAAGAARDTLHISGHKVRLFGLTGGELPPAVLAPIPIAPHSGRWSSDRKRCRLCRQKPPAHQRSRPARTEPARSVAGGHEHGPRNRQCGRHVSRPMPTRCRPVRDWGGKGSGGRRGVVPITRRCRRPAWREGRGMG